MIKLVIKNSFLIFFAVLAFSACELFRIDNYGAPNAELCGRFLDAVTGELVESDVQNGNALRLQEKGYIPGVLTRTVMQSGEYCDKLMFAGTYSISFINCNFYTHEIDEIVVNRGKNTRDFQVTPYIRVRNVNIRRDGNDIVATFTLQAGNPEVRLSNIRLFAHDDMYVGDQVTYGLVGGTDRQTFDPAIVIDDTYEHTLRIDLTLQGNRDILKYSGKEYYFRVGAIAASGGGVVGTVRRNYAPYVKIPVVLP